MTKICSGCRRPQDITNFGKDKNRKDGLNLYCRDCLKKHYQSDKKANAQRCRAYYLKNRESMMLSSWKRHIKSKYGLTYEELVLLAEKQGNSCKICHTKFPTLKSRMVHVDHDHKTGRVRGILCKFCNDQLIRILEHPLKEAGEKYLLANS
jgi:hypothetical protein